jgi:hypothetical protein
MTDPARDQPPSDAQARNRFFLLTILRFSGVALVMFGIAVMMGRVPGLVGDFGRYAGLAIAFAGLLEFGVVPRLLARRWASPRADR